MASEAAVRARLRAFSRRRGTSRRELARALHATDGRSWSHVKLRRFAKGAPLSVDELTQLDRALKNPPTGRKRDRRLEDGHDRAQSIVNARDPWLHYARAATAHIEARDGMRRAECEREWRTVGRRYQECGKRDADGRPTDPNHLLTLNQAIYRLAAPHDTTESNAVSHQTRFVQRRIEAGQVLDEPQPRNPRAAVVVAQLRAFRAQRVLTALALAARCWAQTVALVASFGAPP